MIYLLASGVKDNAKEIVHAALTRSFTSSMVESLSFVALSDKIKTATQQQYFLVIIDPLEVWVDLLLEIYENSNAKLLILGAIPPKLAGYLGVDVRALPDEILSAASCEPAKSYEFAESKMQVEYSNSIGSFHSSITNRPFLRYDFTDEWNNLGYGAIRVDSSIWSLSAIVSVPESACIANIASAKIEFGAYAALWSGDKASILWFNRSVGPVDSVEWELVESYFGDYRPAELPCIPYLSEIPYGYKAAVTMRLDCDEDIESARPLWEAYQLMEVPFSLAIHTKVLTDELQYQLPRDVIVAGGALLSHTATHAPDWGGSYDTAVNEAKTSKQLIKDKIGCDVRYAVSPFHQTPIYARSALSDTGYSGCVGGIIRNDPDFLMGRSGVPPFSDTGFIGHSQQCMLHGDCMLGTDDSLAIFKLAFELAYKSNTFFGYLDHPFSPRYQYGWVSEEQRISAHESFVAYMKSWPDVLFANENDAMDFLRSRSCVRIKKNSESYTVMPDKAFEAKWTVKICYKGSRFKLTKQGVTI